MDPSARYLGFSEPGSCSLNIENAQNNNIQSRPPSQPQDLEDQATLSDPRGWRRAVMHFTPSWFAACMGTGIVSVLLYEFPYPTKALQYTGIVIFCLNILLFCLFTILSIIRYIMFPYLWGCMIQHPVQSLFIGTFPMAISTIVNMIILVCVPIWGEKILMFAWALWWIDVAISAACCMYMPFVIMHIHDAKLSTMTATWLLPIVSTVVAAASGSLVSSALQANHPSHALWTLITSYVLWGCGVPLAMVILVIYFQRLALHHLPPREVIVSVFLPLGPLGSGAFGIMKMGEVADELFKKTGSLPAVSNAGEILYVLGFVVGVVMWGFTLVWLFFALASITRSKFPFNMGFWGFVFPAGVWILATSQISKELPSDFFKVLTAILTVIITLLWIFVSIRTIEKTFMGKLLYSPCVKQYQEAYARRASEQSVSGKSEQQLTSNFGPCGNAIP